MEFVTHAFQSLGYLIEAFSLLTAAAGFFIASRGYKAAGTMIGVGSGLHALGYVLFMHGTPLGQPSPLKSLLISTMYPGLLLLTVGIVSLALTLPRTRANS